MRDHRLSWRGCSTACVSEGFWCRETHIHTFRKHGLSRILRQSAMIVKDGYQANVQTSEAKLS